MSVLRQAAMPLVQYAQLARLWVRVATSYRVSFWMLTIGGFLITGIDFVAIVVLFTAVDSLGGFGLREVAFLYGASGVGIAVADLLVGQVERLGTMVRLGRLDVMMVRPVPLLVQVCTENFTPRRVARVLQAALVLAWGCGVVVWDPAKALLTVSMLVSASLIFGGLFVGLACVQFWTTDSAEVANAFTYGGNTVTSYPLTVFPAEVAKGLTFVVPLAFVNWYPALLVLDRPDPFGMPVWAQAASPVAAGLVVLGAALAWRTGVRRYRSTGS